MNDEKELRRRLEALRLRHNDANELSLTHDCLFADLIAVVEILAKQPRPANECSNAEREQYEQTIRLQNLKIGDLEARLAQLDNIASLTGPKKPTKPFVEPRCDCGRIASSHIQTESGKGWLHCDGTVRLYE
jgi:hypothetical protein